MGEAESIRAVAQATAEAIERVATAIRQPGGQEARTASGRRKSRRGLQPGGIGRHNHTIVPSNMTEVSVLIGSAMKMVQGTSKAA